MCFFRTVALQCSFEQPKVEFLPISFCSSSSASPFSFLSPFTVGWTSTDATTAAERKEPSMKCVQSSWETFSSQEWIFLCIIFACCYYLIAILRKWLAVTKPEVSFGLALTYVLRKTVPFLAVLLANVGLAWPLVQAMTTAVQLCIFLSRPVYEQFCVWLPKKKRGGEERGQKKIVALYWWSSPKLT